MPDLRFSGGKNYFSILNDNNGKHPLLLPRITNPNFLDSNFKMIGPPGIIELIEGDLGLTEFMMKPILDPILAMLDTAPELAVSVANADLSESNPGALDSSFLTGDAAISAAKDVFLKRYIPKDYGMKPIEKTLISSMFESYKPFVDFEKLFIELLAVAEDVTCMFLGTSIKILGNEIGIPSRNPRYWQDDLKYTQTLNHALKEFIEATDVAVKVSEKTISNDHPLKKNVPNPNSSNDKPGGATDIPALYVGYFDEDGNTIDPPAWVKNSGKWFSTTGSDINGNSLTVGSPFEQLSPNINEGVTELRTRHGLILAKMQRDKEKMLAEIDKRAKDLESKNLSPKLMKLEIQTLDDEKKESSRIFQELFDTLEDILDGTNKTKNNYVNDEKPADGINMPIVLNEWSGKVRSSQFRQKYFPEMVSTAQGLIDRNGKAIEPYIFIPSKNVNYKGKNFKIDIPLAFPSQINEKRINSNNTFFDKKKREDNKTYSLQNQITSLDIFHGTSRSEPYVEQSVTHFGNNSKNVFVPDAIKNFYLPVEWEEISEYEIREKNSGNILRTEKDIIPFGIDIENDYELRLIQVINLPLIPPPNNSKSIDYYPNGDDFLMLYENSLKFLKVDDSRKSQLTQLTNSYGNDLTVSTPSRYFRIGDYIDETVFKPNRYIYLRKSNSKLGDDINNTDSDDGNIFKIKKIKEIKKNRTLNLKGLKNKPKQSLIINNSTKTIIDNDKHFSGLATHITQYTKNNFKFKNGTNKNNNKTVRITSIKNEASRIIIKYTGTLSTETITAAYDTKKEKNVIKQIAYEYVDKTIVNTTEEFKGDVSFTADHFIIDDINYIPNELKNPPKSFFALGFDNKSILSTLNTKPTRTNISALLNKKPTNELDGLITITGFGEQELGNGRKVATMKLDISIPDRFQNMTLSSDPNSNFYYPLRFVGYTTQPSGGDSKFIQDQLTESGTLYTDGNTIPGKYNLDKPNELHSTPDIKENNMLKEGIIFHGLDPRYVARNKYKYFWLVEAIKKDKDGLVKINNKANPGDIAMTQTTTTTSADKGKEWYGLIDRYLAPVMIITKLVPIIVTKLIPLSVKIVQLVSNPSKVTELIMSIAITDENISKLPQNFSAFSSTGTMGKIQELETRGVAEDFDIYDERKKSGEDPYVYTGPQIGIENPSIKNLMDGQALAEFGLGAFGKSILSFGVEIKGDQITPIKSLVPTTDFKKPPPKSPQVVVNFLLQILKLPFETLFLIFKWILNWVKKLLNPLKIASAVKEFLRFDWLKNILGKNGILSILGITCPKENKSLQKGISEIRTGAVGENGRFLLDKTKEALRGQDFDFIEVLVYNILVNGAVVATEQEEKPYTGSIPSSTDPNIKVDLSDPSLRERNEKIAENISERSPDGENENLGFCGPRFFNIRKYVPIPFLAPMPSYNACELPIVYLKPLELLSGSFNFIQNIINGFLGIPSAILGLDPLVPLPRFGKEIPFADVLDKILQELKDSTNQLIQK